MHDTAPPRFLTEFSEAALRGALAVTAPELTDLALALTREPDLDRPLWAAAGAVLGEQAFAKFAFSEPTAVRIWREAQMLELLAELGLPVPRLVALGPAPTFVASEVIIGGEPLSFAAVSAAGPERLDGVAVQLAEFLARLHARETLELARLRLDHLGPADPALETSTAALRARLPALAAMSQRPTIERWCDWIDAVLAQPADEVLSHGDFHPYNQLWDLGEPRLLAVVDFETACRAAPEVDFRVLPVFGPGVDLLLATVGHYEALSGRRLSLERIMALHLLNYLGDALWRTEAGIALPEPGTTPAEYVEEAARRLAALGVGP